MQNRLPQSPIRAHKLRVLINRYSYYEIHVQTLVGGWLPLVNTLSAERWPLLTYTYAAIVIRHVEAVAPEIPVPSYITARHMRFPLSLLFNRSHPEKRRITNQSFNQSHTHTHTHKSASPMPSPRRSQKTIFVTSSYRGQEVTGFLAE